MLDACAHVQENSREGAAARPARRRLSTPPVVRWVRERTSLYNRGLKIPGRAGEKGQVVHAIRKAALKDHFRRLRKGERSRLRLKLSNSEYHDHCTGDPVRYTYYFTADERSSTEEVLVMVDIDCHDGKGSFEGAMSFGEHLRGTLFPGLYLEPSTNGGGVHGYLVIRKGGQDAGRLNAALKALDRLLKHVLATSGPWDVQAVEMKGHAPEMMWDEVKYDLRDVKFGQLAKVPRKMLERPDELMATTRLTIADLHRMAAAVPEELPRERGAASIATSAPDEAAAPQDASLVRERRPNVAEPGTSRIPRAGSIAGQHFRADELARLQGHYLRLARELLGEDRPLVSGRKRVTEEDVAIWLMLCRFFSGHMPEDGTMPTERWRGL